jgi:hypothetical protein
MREFKDTPPSFPILTQFNSTTTDLKKAIGQYFDKDTNSLNLTPDNLPLTNSERIHHPRKLNRIIPRLRRGTGTKRRSTRSPVFDPPRFDGKDPGDEGGQIVLDDIQKLIQDMKTRHHPRYKQMQQTTDQVRTQSIELTRVVLHSIHYDSTPCEDNSRSTPSFFPPKQCHHTTMTWEPCPNQIPIVFRTGIGIGTETVTDLDLVQRSLSQQSWVKMYMEDMTDSNERTCLTTWHGSTRCCVL